MVVHYKDKHRNKYPDILCGNNSFGATITEDITKVTCKICLKSYNQKYTRYEVNKVFDKDAKKLKNDL